VEPLPETDKVSKYSDTSHYIAVELAQLRYDNMHGYPKHVIGDSLKMFRYNTRLFGTY